MQGSFDLNKPGWYTPQNVEENEFLNAKLENDKYGIFYSVKFQGDASTHLWQAKQKPEPGKAYWGHIEMTKSGKSTKFKREAPPEESTASAPAPTNATPAWKPKDERQVTRNMVWKNLLQWYDLKTMEPDNEQWQHFWGMVDLHTDKLLPAAEQPAVPLRAPIPSLGDQFRARKPDVVVEDIGLAELGAEDLPEGW